MMREESERSFRFTSPELSPTLVLVLKCLTVAHLVSPPTIAHITTTRSPRVLLNGKEFYSYYIIYMEDMEELGEAEVDLSGPFRSLSLPDGGPENLAFTSVFLRFLFP